MPKPSWTLPNIRICSRSCGCTARRFVGEKGRELGRRGRQPGQVVMGPTQQRGFLGRRGGRKALRFEPGLLILTGTTERTRKLRLVSWAAVPRIVKEIEFPWEGDNWYTSKLSVDIVRGKAQVAAKVWARGEDEPQAWTLTMEDATPNLTGSPGLYAYAVSITEKSKGTEVLFDNVSITPNP